VQIRRCATGIEVAAPAKVNLFFEVLNRRDDGYHEIETLMAPIGLYDTLILEDQPAGDVAMTARWAIGNRKQRGGEAQRQAQSLIDEAETIPTGDKNHAVRAVRTLAEAAGVGRGAKLRLIKRIPMAAGLGGGSSDAAAALMAANLAWRLNWSIERLAEIAAKVGSDVPFFLYGGAAICRGRGEKIELVDGIGGLHLVVAKPPIGLSTPAVYKACRPGDPPASVNPVIQSLRKGEWNRIGPRLHNRLLEPASKLSDWIDRTMVRLADEDFPAVGMSGSGSSCIGICRSALQARRIASRLRQARPEMGSVWAARSL
jgi:4-diphosphocytidyl-2-C-methyl-D-erythritol kinase